jgi:serpin B
LSRSVRLGAAVVVLALLAGACGSGDDSSTATTSSSTTSAAVNGNPDATGVNTFAFKLLHENLGAAKGNIALSPWSIATALGMARLGAKGPTATEMDALQPADAAMLKALNAALLSRNGSFGADKAVEVTAANRAFAQKDLTFERAFLDALKDDFASTLGLVDYKTAAEPARVEINRWVADNTKDRIKELIAKDLLDAMTRLVLVNAVYLKADWEIPFEKDLTNDGTFNAPGGSVTAKFMHSTDSHRFASGDGWQAVELNYAGGKLAMDVILPDAGRFDAVAGGVSADTLRVFDDAKSEAVELALPKWDFGKALQLKDQLIALGMPTAFSDTADFSGMTKEEQLQISDVVHQANITVDEKGTVAAAATAVIMRTTSAPLIEHHLIADRPFLFFLRDRPTGTVLFAGQVTDPTKT